MKNFISPDVRRNAGRRGFTILEVMLATLLLSTAIIGLAICLNKTIEVESFRRREAEVQTQLQSRLAEARVMPLKIGIETLEPDSKGVVYEKEVTALQLVNAQK